MYSCDFICTTMQQSVEQSWSKLHGDVSRSTLYCSIQGSLSRTSFSTFQSVSYKRNIDLQSVFFPQEKANKILRHCCPCMPVLCGYNNFMHAYHLEALQENTEGRCIGQVGWTHCGCRSRSSSRGSGAASRRRCWTCGLLFTHTLLWLPKTTDSVNSSVNI